MILEKFEDLLIPLKDISKKVDYRNIEVLNKLNVIVNNKKLIHEFDNDIDTSILYAINYFDNLNSFVIFGKNKDDSYRYYCENFSKDYFIYGLKHMRIKATLIQKIMYQLLFPRIIIKNKQFLTNYLKSEYKFLQEYDKEFIDVTTLLLCKRDLNKKYPSEDIVEKNFCVYIPNTKESIIICASLFFCESSIQFLELQNFDYFLTNDMKKSKNMLLKYRSWIYENIDHKDHSQFMLYSSVVLYLLGHREMNDIDLYIHTISDQDIEKTNKLDTFGFVDYSIKNTSKWPNYWNEWLDKWAQKCGAKYFEEFLGNSEYHFYFLGLKIISLKCDIVRRLERFRPRAYADLIALRKRYHYKVDIPYIPSKLTKYISIQDKSESEIEELIKKGGILNSKNKEISLETETNIDKFIDTIIYALKTRYNMVFTVVEVKRELNMYSESVDNKKRVKIIIKR